MQNISEKAAAMVVDIGNTNIVCAIYHNDELKGSVRLHSSRDRTADEFYSALYSLMGKNPEVQPSVLGKINKVAISSVVPELTRVWLYMFKRFFHADVYEINYQSPLGLQFKAENPATVGADLIANAFAAWKKYKTASIIIDLGTATTMQLVSATGVFEGTIIAPGIRTGAINLFEKAAQLYEIELTNPNKLLGTNTVDAMLSGIVYGHAFMLETFIQKLKAQYFDYAPITVILSGGLTELMKQYMPSVDIIDNNLTLDGMYMALNLLQATPPKPIYD